MLFGQKIKAVRAMCDMTREAFCDYAGLSLTALDNLEANGPTQKKTEQRVLRAVASLGFELGENSITGIKRTVTWLNDYMELLEDIKITAPRDVLFLNADDRKSPREVNDFTAFLVAKMKCRFLCSTDVDEFTFRSFAKYRTSDLLGARDVAVIYADHVGLYTPDGVMLIINQWIADDYREQFEILWERGHDV